VQRWELVQRNGQRLLKLVNSLLDFSRIEAGRVEASYEPTDLAQLTSDLASLFRSAIESAGLRLRLDLETLREPVYVDREMWEKIVLNLLRWNDPEAALPAPLAPAESSRQERILAVDDNPDMREYLARILSTRWQVQTAPDGAAALEAIRAGRTRTGAVRRWQDSTRTSSSPSSSTASRRSSPASPEGAVSR